MVRDGDTNSPRDCWTMLSEPLARLAEPISVSNLQSEGKRRVKKILHEFVGDCLARMRRSANVLVREIVLARRPTFLGVNPWAVDGA